MRIELKNLQRSGSSNSKGEGKWRRSEEEMAYFWSWSERVSKLNNVSDCALFLEINYMNLMEYFAIDVIETLGMVWEERRVRWEKR
jgi:hypothetical protein